MSLRHRFRRRSGRSAEAGSRTDEVVASEPTSEQRWFDEHFHEAADAALAFLGDAGVGLEGKRVADVGAGDGIIDLALALRGRPAELIGFDVNPVGADQLLARARAAGIELDGLPPGLDFRLSQPNVLPAETHQFDRIVTWSAFEHVEQPVWLLKEIKRVLAEDGVLFLQLWPFYRSQHGGHLWEWFPEGFEHLRRHEDDIVESMRASDVEAGFTGYMIDEVRHLNRITPNGLQRALLSAGFQVTKLELLSHPAHVPEDLVQLPLSDLAIGGVKLLAVPS